jgi:hypothetical protein
VKMTTVFLSSTAPPPSVSVRREKFTLVDASLNPQKTSVTMFEARTSLKPGWLVVPELEAKA